MYPILPRRQSLWLLRVDHAGVAAFGAAVCGITVLGLCALELEVSPAESVLRAATVFVLTYAASLAWLVLYQRGVVKALAREYAVVTAARRAARKAAARTDTNTRGEDEAAMQPERSS